MEYRNRIYNLIINEQLALIELLKCLEVSEPKEKIHKLLDTQLFEIIDCDKNTIKKIKNKITDEVFEIGCKFYHKKFQSWHTLGYFDDSLFGTFYGNSYYKNYVRSTSGGLYNLAEISLTDKIPDIAPQEIVIGGITYLITPK